MSHINILPKTIYSKIAAGEVIERPASVVKELVENSIDAGARNIGIYVNGGGIDSIAVIDDGCGIYNDELECAFRAHTTSKLSKADDLLEIKTLGFRGEALASIAAVSQLTVWSKCKDEELGGKILLIGGDCLRKELLPAEKSGTKIEITKLFYNMPQKLKFLKRPSSEAAEITNLIAKFILSNPYISFKYVLDDQDIYYTRGTSLREAFFSIYGKAVLDNSFELDSSYKDVSVSGIVCRPSILKPNTTCQTIVVNGRIVKDDTISFAVKNAFSGFTMTREYPIYCLFIDLPADQIDANVHPNKLEVKYQNREDVYRGVYHPIRKELTENKIKLTAQDVVNNSIDDLSKYAEGIQTDINDIEVPDLNKIPKEKAANIEETSDANRTFGDLTSMPLKGISNPHVKKRIEIQDLPFNKPPVVGLGEKKLANMDEKFYKRAEDTDIIEGRQESEYAKENHTCGVECRPERYTSVPINVVNEFDDGNTLTEEEKDIILDAETEKVTSFSSCTTLGTIFDCYIIAQTENKKAILIIDKHAAHERILYDRYMYALEHGPVAVQTCVFPTEFNLTPEQIDFIESIKDTLMTFGFDIEIDQKDKLVVKGWPAGFYKYDLNFFFNSLMSENEYSFDIENINKYYIAKKACRAAIRGGQTLNLLDIKYLFERLDENRNLKCPHGRPIVFAIKKSAFDRLFKREV